MKIIAISLTLLALTCSEEVEIDVGAASTAADGGPRATDAGSRATDAGSRATDAGSRVADGGCELLCHDYGGGIEECTCEEADLGVDGAADLGPAEPPRDPYE